MAAPRRPRRIAVVFGAAALVVLADQLTKTWAEGRVSNRSIDVFWTLRFRLALNPGVAFSVGRGSTGFVTAVALGVLLVVGIVAWRSSGQMLGVALGLIMGGAAGNVADRLFRGNGGQVIDFIDLRWWPVFNVADAAITCGVLLALFANVRGMHVASDVAHPPAT
jgi:signal peptidase II